MSRASRAIWVGVGSPQRRVVEWKYRVPLLFADLSIIVCYLDLRAYEVFRKVLFGT